ncbi:hypothetical protein Pelo_10538 [Pelomyxa schiedti]|nr:hypothetical protein Pelo_10538 [Pelomyxa schiedti]
MDARKGNTAAALASNRRLQQPQLTTPIRGKPEARRGGAAVVRSPPSRHHKPTSTSTPTPRRKSARKLEVRESAAAAASRNNNGEDEPATPIRARVSATPSAAAGGVGGASGKGAGAEGAKEAVPVVDAVGEAVERLWAVTESCDGRLGVLDKQNTQWLEGFLPNVLRMANFFGINECETWETYPINPVNIDYSSLGEFASLRRLQVHPQVLKHSAVRECGIFPPRSDHVLNAEAKTPRKRLAGNAIEVASPSPKRAAISVNDAKHPTKLDVECGLCGAQFEEVDDPHFLEHLAICGKTGKPANTLQQLQRPLLSPPTNSITKQPEVQLKMQLQPHFQPPPLQTEAVLPFQQLQAIPQPHPQLQSQSQSQPQLQPQAQSQPPAQLQVLPQPKLPAQAQPQLQPQLQQQQSQPLPHLQSQQQPRSQQQPQQVEVQVQTQPQPQAQPQQLPPPQHRQQQKQLHPQQPLLVQQYKNQPEIQLSSLQRNPTESAPQNAAEKVRSQPPISQVQGLSELLPIKPAPSKDIPPVTHQVVSPPPVTENLTVHSQIPQTSRTPATALQKGISPPVENQQPVAQVSAAPSGTQNTAVIPTASALAPVSQKPPESPRKDSALQMPPPSTPRPKAVAPKQQVTPKAKQPPKVKTAPPTPESEYSSEDFNSSDSDSDKGPLDHLCPKPLPPWALRKSLTRALTRQAARDPDEIFKMEENCDIHALFPGDKIRKRGSSAVWSPEKVLFHNP